MIPEVGQRFGPYEILGRLGAGGMGLVFRAWDGRLHREVAVKMLHADLAMPRLRERFLREARAASALSHPNICTIFDIGEQDAELFLVMELLEGETFKERVTRGALPIEELLRYGCQMASALEAAHLKGIVHRDIKPANIFLVNGIDSRCHVKVLDFGLAQVGPHLGGRGRGLELTSEGATVGTVAYMSPEQARGELLDARSDLFSLGIVLYEMATGQVPFRGNTSAMVFVQLLEHAPEPMRSWNDAVPRELERIVLKLLAKDRKNRFQSARELEEAFERALRDKGLGKDKGGGKKVSQTRSQANSQPAQASSTPQALFADQVARVRPEATPVSAAIPESEIPSLGGDPGMRDRRTLRRVATPILKPDEDQAAPQIERRADRPDRRNINQPLTYTPDRRGQRSAEEDTRDASMLESPLANHQPSPQGLPPFHPPADFDWSEYAHTDPRDAQRISPDAALEGDSVQSRPSRIFQTAALPADATRSAQDVLHEIESARRLRGQRNGVRGSAAVPARDASGLVAPGKLPVRHPAGTAPEPSTSDAEPERRNTLGRSIALSIAAVLALTAAGVYWSDILRPAPVSGRSRLLLAGIANHTADPSLEGAVLAGLRLKLEQSTLLTLPGWNAYSETIKSLGLDPSRNSSESMALKAAERAGAPMFLYGEIEPARTSSGLPYSLYVEVIDTASKERMVPLVKAEETVATRDQLAGALDRLAVKIRAGLGEGADSITQSNLPLVQQATANPDALSAFADGQRSLNTPGEGEREQALAAFRRAIAGDPKFVQAQLALVSMFSSEHAETAAAAASRLAEAGGRGSNQRTQSLVQAVFELNSNGNLVRAAELAQQLVAADPHDAESLALLAQALRRQGHFAEALTAAEQAEAADPFDRYAQSEAEDALLSLDRYEDVLTLEGKKNFSRRNAGASLLAAYATGQESAIAAQLTNLKSIDESRNRSSAYATYLDNTGAFIAGEAEWKTAAAALEGDPLLPSRQAYLLALGALNRSLVGECAPALEMAHRAAALEHGPEATFNTGMTEALCGDLPGAATMIHSLETDYPQNTAVTGYLLVDLRGTIELRQGHADAAIDTLKTASAFDAVSLTPYLLGLAHLSLRQKDAVGDFRQALDHRGVELVAGNDVYPAAQLGLARAFDMEGDAMHSTMAYRRLLELLHDGDPGSAMLREANDKTAIAQEP